MMGTNLLNSLGSEVERLRRSLRPSSAGLRQIARALLNEAGEAGYPSDALWVDLPAGRDERREILSRSLLAARAVAWMGVHFAEVYSEAEWLVVAALIADAGRLRLERPILPADDPNHPGLAAALAGGLVDAPVSLVRWVRNHHERSDGSGYPFGLSARGLPGEDRVLAAAVRFAELFDGSADAAARRLHDEARCGAFDVEVTANFVWSIAGSLPTDAGFDRAAPQAMMLTDFGRRRLRLDQAHPVLRGPHFAIQPAGTPHTTSTARP